MIVEGFEIDPQRIPFHIAIIMDGNGRWAKNRNLNRIAGHRKGAETLVNIINACKELNVKVLSVFGFSSENWNRPEEEVSGIMDIFVEFFKRNIPYIIKEKIKVTHTGVISQLPKKVQKAIQKITSLTNNYEGPILNIAFNYGGRQEIVDSTKKIATLVKEGSLNTTEINENTIRNNLYHPEIKEPDLLIRTSGELRISNFMLWQLAYSELWFTKTLWPDFSKKELVEAIYDFQKRERRFGEIK